MEQSYFAIVYGDESKARQAQQILKKLHLSAFINLKNAALVVRGVDGQLVAENRPGLKLFNLKYGLAGLVGTAAGMIGAAPLGPAVLVIAPFMGAANTAAAVGYDWLKVKGAQNDLPPKIEESIPPGSAALIVQAEVINLTATLKELGRLRDGEIVPINMSRAFYQQLTEALAN